MSLEITGKLHKVDAAVAISEKFTKRDFVVELAVEINGNSYPEYAAMQLVNAKCSLLDKFNVGDQIKVGFNIKGKRWEKDGKEKYFSNLDAWRIESANGAAPNTQGNHQQQQQAPNNYNNNNNANNQYSQNNNNNNQNSYAPAPQYNNAAPDGNDDLPF